MVWNLEILGFETGSGLKSVSPQITFAEQQSKMESFKNFLQQFPTYKPAVYESAKGYLSSTELKAGDYFLREGVICKSIAFVEEGMMRTFYLSDGKEVTNCFCKEGTIATSYSSLITQKSSEIAIQAIEPTKLTVLTYKDLQKLYNADGFWQQVGRLASENEFINSECHHRFLNHLSATDRYLQTLEKEPDLLQRVPLTYLASYIQVAPETLSRIRKKITRT